MAHCPNISHHFLLYFQPFQPTTHSHSQPNPSLIFKIHTNFYNALDLFLDGLIFLSNLLQRFTALTLIALFISAWFISISCKSSVYPLDVGIWSSLSLKVSISEF